MISPKEDRASFQAFADTDSDSVQVEWFYPDPEKPKWPQDRDKISVPLVSLCSTCQREKV
jgi:hypothetical protein